MTRIRQISIAGLLALMAACNGSSSSNGASPVNSDKTGDAGAMAAGSDNISSLDFGEPSINQIRPGVEVAADGASCTSNFLYYLNDETVFLGAAAHCFSRDANAGIDPCETANLAIGSPVFIENANHSGTLAYTSWQAMQETGETPGTAVCAYNDFALVKLHPDDVANIHPAVFGYGGPVGLAVGVAAVGDTVYAYGHSMFHLGVEMLETRRGAIAAVLGGGWFYDVANELPGLGIPGDSGGPVLDAQGRALAVTSVLTLSTGETLVSNGVVNLDKALAYAKGHGFINRGVELISWSEFDAGGSILGLPGL